MLDILHGVEFFNGFLQCDEETQQCIIKLYWFVICSESHILKIAVAELIADLIFPK